MTTPAHCTRTWTSTPCYAEQSGIHACSALDSYHHVQHVCVCGNVEPPADVAATPDPRLDVVATIVGDVRSPESYREMAQVILDALDAMRPDEPSIHTFVADEGWTEEQSFTPAPAGLSAAQEIRLELARVYGYDGTTPEEGIAKARTWAAWVEHGPDETPALLAEYQRGLVLRVLDRAGDEAPGIAVEIRAILNGDETPDLRPSKEWRDALMQTERGWKDAAVRAEQAEARADLAEARLGQVRDALRDYEGSHDTGAGFRVTVAECLAWTPDDTATADAATGDGS